MKRLSVLVVSVISSYILFTGCYQYIIGSAKTVTVTSDIDDFVKVDLDNMCQATITQGDEFSISITVNENIEPYLNVEKSFSERKSLMIYLDRGYVYENLVLEAEITMPSLTELDMKDAAAADIDGFAAGDDFTALLVDKSVLTGNLIADEANIQALAESKVTLEGRCRYLVLQSFDNSEINLEDFPASGFCNFQLNGQTEATVTACKGIIGQISGESKLYHYGSPLKIVMNDSSRIVYEGTSAYCN